MTEDKKEAKLRPEDMPEYQDKLSQSIIKAGREEGNSDEEILEFLKAFL